MNHDQFREALSALHDKELDARESKEILSHLEQCADCREAHQRWEKIAGTFFRAPQPPGRAETEFFVQQVMKRLEPELSPAPFGWWGWLEDRLMLPVLSVSLVAVLLSILMIQPESVASTDALLLVNAQNHSIGQWVLPPDPSNTDGMLTHGLEAQ